MPYTTELTEDYMGIVHLGSGVVTGSELLEACRATTQLVQNTANFHYELIDFSDAHELIITPDDLDRIVAQDHFAAVFRPGAFVVIAAPNEKIFETVVQWEQRILDLGWKTHVARSRGDALAWLHENFTPPAPQSEAAAETSVPDAEAR